MSGIYLAHAFLPGSGERRRGQLTVDLQAVTFEGASPDIGTHRLPLGDLGVRWSGHNNQTCFLSHPSQPGLEIACDDAALREDAVLGQLPAFRQALQSSKQHARRLWGCVAISAVLALLLLVVALVTGRALLELLLGFF